MNTTDRAAVSSANGLRLPSPGQRHGSAAQIAARDRFAAEWGGQQGHIAKRDTPERKG